MKTVNEQFMERIQKVESKIRAYARFFAYKSSLLDEDDLFQTAMEKLLERYYEDPNFLNSNNSYIACFASWMMKNALNHERALYGKHVADLEQEECEIPLPTGHFPSPETEAIRSEVHDMANQMPDEYRKIFSSITDGFTSNEIAKIIGVGKWAFDRRKRIMVETLSKAWRLPQSERKHLIREM